MLCGKAIARAIRGHFLVDGALNTLLAANAFQVKLPIPAGYAVDSEDLSELTEDCTIADDNEDTQHEHVSDQLDGESTDHGKVLPEELAEASDLYDIVMAATTTETNASEILQLIAQHLEAQGELYFMSEPKKSSSSSRRFLNIGHARDVLDVTSGHPASGPGEMRPGREDEDQTSSSHSSEEAEDHAKEKEQLTSNNSDGAARDGTGPQDLADNTTSPIAVETSATPSIPHQTASDGQSVTARELPSSPTPHTEKLTEQQTSAPPDIDAADDPDAVLVPPGKPSSSLSEPLLSTSTKETGSAAVELAEQTPEEEHDSAGTQPASEIPDGDAGTSHETPEDESREWHQYDDVIYVEMKKGFLGIWNNSQTAKKAVMNGRDQAGRVMLRNIFDLLTTWTKPNVENFFFLLRQFFFTYSYPLLHRGMAKPWGLPYGEEQVKVLLKGFIEEHVIPQPRQKNENPKVFLDPLHAGVIALLLYNKYLRDSIRDQLSNLCHLLCLPPDHVLTDWKNFTSALPDQKSVADAVEVLCNDARQDEIEKWVLVIPLIHLLRGDSKPFEPVLPVLNPQFDSWTGRKNSGNNVYRDRNASLDDLMGFISSVHVDLLDILHHMHFNIKSGITYFNYAVWDKLISLCFNHKELTLSWRTTFKDDFEGKLKREKPMDQIKIYCGKMEELSKTKPLLYNSVEKCALEAVAAICQDKSGRAVCSLLEKLDMRKFGKLMSVIVQNSWPTDANGDYVEGEELVFEYLLGWPMARVIFQTTGGRGSLIDKLSGDAQIRMTLASSAFKSVAEKFLSGNIQIKTLNQILQNEQEFAQLLKIDGLCDDGRCKDDREMRRLLRLRRVEVEAVYSEKELVKGLLHFCQELPKHVKVDVKGLDKRNQCNIETMTLDNFMEVHRLDRPTSAETVLVTYFDLSDNTRQMASELHAITESLIFNMCWAHQVEELSRDQPDTEDTEQLDRNEEIYTLDLIYSKIFQSCYYKYIQIYEVLKDGSVSLEEVDSIFEGYNGNYKDMENDLEIMCRTNASDTRTWIKGRIHQIKQYHGLHLAVESSRVIMDIKKILCPDGDFTVLHKLLKMNEADFKKHNLNYIDNTLMETKKILKDITDDRRECLQELSLRQKFVLWVKEALKDITELKVFVDLASISAGENDLDVDRVACFHDAVLGYSSILYGLEPNSDFQTFMDSLTKLWKALENDRNIPKKLRDTARHLEWLKTVKESHGSVELSSLSLATSINNRGIYIIKPQNQTKLSLETSMMLQIQEGRDKNTTRTYELEDLKELQNKLMLISGRGVQNQSEVDHFAEVFDNVQRLASAFVDLYAAGNPLFRCWKAEIYCKPQSDPCIIMEFNFGKTLHHLKVCGKLVEQLTALSKKMELFLDDWRNFMDKQRSEHYYLNYFTAEQIVYLCNVLTQTNVNAEIEDKALMMLSFIKPNCTASDVWKTWTRFCNQSEPEKRKNEDIQLFHHQDDRDDVSLACESHATVDDLADKVDQAVGLRELEESWNAYMENMGILSPDSLDVQSLGILLKMMTITENQDEDEWEGPVLSETRDSSFRRDLPKGLVLNQPNLIICPHDEILSSCICLYMTSDYEPLPSYDEVLLCTPATPFEEVELFLRRCLTLGNLGQRIYTILWADQLSYDVSCEMEKCFQKLSSRRKHPYRLVIYCSSDREHTYIPTAFTQFKRDIVPQAPLERIQGYLSRHYAVSSDQTSAASVFKRGQCVGIVSSRRAGVGKSLYVQRLYENLEGCVKQGTAFKKCIRLTEPEIDDHKILQSLYDTPRDQNHKVFHFDVTSSVRKGLDAFLFKLFFLRYLMDSDGLMWQCSKEHLYIVELLESTHEQPRHADRSGRKENFTFFEVFPKVLCRPPKEVVALEMKRGDNPALESDGPLMDDECFKSEAYQRPYQYLTRFYSGDNLDNFTYCGIEGSHAECLQMLFIYCGIIDPSWAELRNFAWFLNLQLQDCENSVFCNSEFVGDTLHGFKNFVVEFMIVMSKDFATPSLCISDQSPGRQHIDLKGLNERDLAPFLIRKRWESEPHPYIFFNDDHVSMTFIGFHLRLNDQNGVDAINPSTREVIKRNIMTHALFTGLKLQRVPFNMDFDQLPRAEKIEHLCSVLGVKWPTDPDETYELTTDNILKMMAIHMRFRCGIPVIIMGETGCGKTRLIKFLCELRRCGAPTENMKLVKVHGGTTSEMIYAKVQEAETLAETNTEKYGFDSVLFFDEANTTEAISSIKEIICDNTAQGQQLDSETGLQVIAACNPYRKHTDKMIERLEASGLGYRVRAEETEDRLGSIPLRQLVYRVQVLPPSMIPLVWDFGQLNDSTEKMYIEQIVQKQVDTNVINKRYIRKIIEVLSSSQQFMRNRKDECSFVSLRDVERCMHVFVWFHKNHPMFARELNGFSQKQKSRTEQLLSPASDRVIWSLLMAIGVCYQACLETKEQYQSTISQILSGEYTPKRIRQEIQLMQDLLLSDVPMGETIARNEALKENVFMMVICIELRIPLFIVGKPGSSKSLSKTLVGDVMQGPASYSELYKRMKQIHLVCFQCSPHSTPEGIINTFKQCARFQESKNLDEYISVVVLDEIGLAEDSPKMPLKTLHPLLEEGCIDDEPLPHKRVGFIGISNWSLDPAKMNRGIFVSRGDPNQNELIKSARGICSSDVKILEKIKHLFKPFANAYMTICKEGNGFFGLRDFYSLIKMVFTVTKASNQSPTADEITRAVLRNFSGKDDVDFMSIFSKELNDDFTNSCISAIELIKQSMSTVSQEQESRYLLILTKNYAALQILQQMFFSEQNHPKIIFGSSFPKDQEYTQICRNINRVKVCMETGQTVVLLNLQNLYESLYDALNQYCVTLGGQKYVDLGLGTHRVKCRVHKNFRLIVIEEKEVVYKQFPIPLINRLEKHYLDINTVLRNEQKDTVKELQKWVDDFVSSSQHNNMTTQHVPSDVFIGYHSDTCSSVVLQVTEKLNDEAEAQNVLEKAKDILLSCATPDSVVRLDNSRLFDEERERLLHEYFEGGMHRSLGDYIVSHTQQAQQSNFYFTEVTTFSRLLTAADTQQLQNVTMLDDIKLLSLHQFDTEYSFLKKIRECLGSTHADKVLIIQTNYDEDFRSRNVLSSAKYSCINEINKWATSDRSKTFVYFVTKLTRIEGGTSYVGFQGGPWQSVHIDDLRRSKEFVSDVQSLKNLRISELFEDTPEDVLDTADLVRSCVQSAVSMLRDEEDSGEFSTKRVENLLTLLDGSETQGVFVTVVRKRLHSLLEDYEADISYPKHWVLKEASNDTALQEGGTFTHALWRKVQAVVTPLLANLVSVIDRDCNLDLLIDGGEDIKNLWLEIFTCKEMLDVPYVRVESNSKVFMVQSHLVAGNTMRCAMPFSWWIKDFLDVLLMQTRKHEDLFWNLPLGHYMTEKVNDKMEREFFQRYLQDFVSMTMKVETDAELKLLCEALTSCVNELQRRRNCEESPTLPHIHRAYHFYHSRVLDVYAAVACVECMEPPPLETDAHCQDWLKQVKRLQGSMELICSQHNTKQYGERCKERLHDIRNGWKRIYALSLFVEHMLLGFDNEDKQLRSLILDHIHTLGRALGGNCDVKSEKAFRAVIQVLKSCKQRASEQICKFGLQCAICMREPQDPVELPCCHVYCSACIRGSLDVPQTSCPMCRQQIPHDFHANVSEHIRDDVLGETMEAEDVGNKEFRRFFGKQQLGEWNEMGSLGKAVDYCKLGVVDLLEHLKVDGAQDKQPVAGAATRVRMEPLSRSDDGFDLPGDCGDEAGSRDSIKKNAEFMRRCNGFFIDLVSTVCFKDNTPPTGGVITPHLLSFLMVKTEHNQIQTKDLSPFDESLDKNPVVRSVILKLLLKFSFDQVKEYLQQHLSSVEDSRIVDEGDKAELYALYINCLEDSMWEKMPQEGTKAERLRPFFIEQTQFLHHFLTVVTQLPATVTVEHLQHIARLRQSLTVAAQLISDLLYEDNIPEEAKEFLDAVVKLCEQSGNDWFRVYLIRKLSALQGVELVQTLVKEPELSWLFPAEIHQQNARGGQMDQYLVYGADYQAVRNAVAKAVMEGKAEEIEEVCQVGHLPLLFGGQSISLQGQHRMGINTTASLANPYPPYRYLHNIWRHAFKNQLLFSFYVGHGHLCYLGQWLALWDLHWLPLQFCLDLALKLFHVECSVAWCWNRDPLRQDGIVPILQFLFQGPCFSAGLEEGRQLMWPLLLLRLCQGTQKSEESLVKPLTGPVPLRMIGGSAALLATIELNCTAPPRKRTMFILLALFREVTTLYKSANTGLHPTPQQHQVLEVFIHGSRFLHQREVRDFATALVHNRLGGLSIHSDLNTVDITVVELAVHLAAVLLTGTHGLLMPLQQLGLSPNTMLGAFIPTMPDDMLAVAQRLIQQNHGQLTWYVCPNNHPCFVDECGLPMQRGHCLECGLEVGGENHMAVAGFRPISQQGDRTRPGHILGDPQRRNNPDTKNMSLIPFTLVRLVTHLAMLVGASDQAQFVQQIIQPPVQDVWLFLFQHVLKDMDQLTEALGRGADDNVTTAHLMLKSLLEPIQAIQSGFDPHLATKASRNAWETTVAADIMTPQLKHLDQLLKDANATIRNDSRVSSNFIMRVTFGDECPFLTSLPRGSQVHSSAVWSCRERLSLLSLTHIVEQNDQKENLPLLWRFLQKEIEFRQVKFLPDILTLQRNLVRKFQNASDQMPGSIAELIEKQTAPIRMWYEKHIHIFLNTWNLLRESVTCSEMKIPEEFCSEDLDLKSDFQYLLPRRQGPGLCATALVSHLVALHNDLVYAVDHHTGEDSSSYKVSLTELTEHHVIGYELEKDLLPLVLSNCQYSMERGHETVSEYDLPKIQQQILTRFLQGKPFITRTGVPTLINTHERDCETIFKVVKGKVPQEPLSSLARNALSRELDSYSEVCEALKVLELVLGFLSMTGGSPTMLLVDYLQDRLKMANQTDPHILKALARCRLSHCVSLWQLLLSLKSESMLRLRREPFTGHPAEYQQPLTEEEQRQLKGFVSKGDVDKWLLEMHEFLLLSLGVPRATDTYNPSWSVKEVVAAYMDRKEVEVPDDVDASFPDNIQLSQIVETWKYAVIAKHDWMM
ncbi:LOW QUALITY PROTEIN: E3 ubiquitin-protein ligase rnf213-alpha-like [Diretmus argenteus]